MHSILHISDLHRSPDPDDVITNDELISALVGDLSRYPDGNPPIMAPDSIIISGDLVQGIPLGTADASARLEEQYATAEGFLAELTERFVGGDRSKVIIVPGNHDVNWAVARAAMTPVGDDDAPDDLAQELCREDTLYRWNWTTRQLFKITDEAGYARRFDAFWDFFERFYAGIPGLLRVQRRGDANLFSLCNGRIGVAAFNSCHGNDCFAFHGSVPRGVIGRTHLDLIRRPHAFELLIAVWHHDVEGPPYRTDYMDINIVRSMIGRGFRIGLFGHQHRTNASPHRILLSGRETMAMIGAGSLCAGARELPLGARRQYNVIEIADDMRSACVHVREMSVDNLFRPSPRPEFGGNSWTQLDWEPAADLMGRVPDPASVRVRAAIENAEAALRGGSPGAVVAQLQPLRPDLPPYGRKLLIEAARTDGNRELLLDLLTPPQSIGELVEYTETCISERDFTSAASVLDAHAHRLGLAEPHEQELRARLSAAEAMAR